MSWLFLMSVATTTAALSFWNSLAGWAPLAVLDDVAGGILSRQLRVHQFLLDVDGKGFAIRCNCPRRLQVGPDKLIQLPALGWVLGDDDAIGRVLCVSQRDRCDAMVWVGILTHLDDGVLLWNWVGILAEVHGGGFADVGRQPCSKPVRIVGVDPRVVLRTRNRDVG